KDCYKCVRHCVVKAIQVKDSHARIITNRCIQCGKCIDVCPQHAIRAISSLDQVKNLILTKSTNVVSLSPTFTVAFPEYNPAQFVRALLKLGFKAVEESSAAAYWVLREYEKLIQEEKFIISSECPALVNLIEVYHPELIEFLAPVDSAMLAHAKLLKKAYKQNNDENVKVIYIGPCQSAKSENERFDGEVDYILSFEDIRKWFREQSIYPEVIDNAPFETPELHTQEKNSRLYPIQGGMLYRIGINPFALNFLKVSGFASCKRFLESISSNHESLKFAEMLICEDGCLGAPMMNQNSPQLAKMKLLEYAKSNNKIPNIFDYEGTEVDLTRTFKKRDIIFKDVEESEIQEILKKSGKIGTEDELNCGACGYYSCRDKAIAVVQGMAEYEMCIPYMREMAESRANRIIERDPNGVCEVDDQYKVVQYNEAFKVIFDLPNYTELAGKDIREFIDIDIFNPDYKNKPAALVHSKKRNKDIEIISFDLIEDGMHVVIVTDITQKSANRDRINALKEQTIEKANEVIHKQMRVAQEIASLLGETTAETKVTLLDLMKVFREETKE
ncbi:MAG TPA: [Fe-Fe] hydrogenase large subunit C-terminal domain-containing protein, partial [Candidatus Cloacimonadota bacterium]|nr:[Fe-Fe] hydrogenase large subunit C-terminal domain-containing protein [Candidatus Cloacimonadota bacterium]